MGLVVVPRGLRFSRLVVGLGVVVGVGLVGALQALVGVVGVVVVVVGCARAPGVVVVGGPELVLVEALRPKHIWELSFSFSSFTSHFQLS